MALLVLLMTSLLAVFARGEMVGAQEVNLGGDLPADASLGDEFQLTVTFSSPAANFVAIEPAMWTPSRISMRPQSP